MKRYTAIAAAVLMVGFTVQSCKKESFPEVEKFESLLGLPSSAEMRLAFTEMTSTEKVNFWKYNLRKNMDGLSVIQKKLISEIYDQFSPAAYENGSNENIRLKTLIVPEWLKKAENVFSSDKLWELFYFLEGENLRKVTPDTYVLDQTEPVSAIYNESAPNCLCNIGSMYTCRKKEVSVGLTGVSMKIIYGSCNYSGSSYICDRDDFGCGYMSLWSCNGNSCTY